MIHKKNYCYRDPEASSGDTFLECNLTQASPNTPILVGLTGLTFQDCNLINCLLPPDSNIIGKCNTNQVEFDVVVDTVDIGGEVFEIKGDRIVGRKVIT